MGPKAVQKLVLPAVGIEPPVGVCVELSTSSEHTPQLDCSDEARLEDQKENDLGANSTVRLHWPVVLFLRL